MIPACVIVAVHVDSGKWVDVPVTPDTQCRDVIECCREPTHEQCSLLQITSLREIVVPEEAYMVDILNRWGSNWPAVTFRLHYSDPLEDVYASHPFPHAAMKEFRTWHKKLPESNDLSLADLRQMAARQQHQIEAHQQLLVAKEQRLKFLKQQEARHHQGQVAHAQEGDRLRHLRERVEVQELKLRRLRALRGQVEQHKSNNNNLGAELESIRALFNEKEKELCVAVAKVEELTRQLEEVRRGDIKHTPSPAAVEFHKLKRELLYRSKLNEQQNARIAQQRETLAKRQSEISQMDQRIAELQHRLQRKRLLNQQLSSQLHLASRSRPLRSNIAAVEPLKRPPEEKKEIEFTPNKKDPKYQTLPYNTKFPLGDEKPPPYPEPPSATHKPPPPTTKPPPPPNSAAGRPTRLGTTTNGVAPVTSTANVITSQPASLSPPNTARSKPPFTPTSSPQTVLPPTVMTSAQSRTVPQTPVRQHPAYNFSGRTAQKPAVPPKPPAPPSKPVLPPRQAHGVKGDTVDHAISVLKGDTQRVIPVTPQSSLQQRLNPSVYNHHPPSKPPESPETPLQNGGDSSPSKLTNGHSEVHISLNRRIGMPPACFFPENQTPPSDLKRRPFTGPEDMQMLKLEIDSDSSLSPKTAEKTKEPSENGPVSSSASSLSPDSTDLSISDGELSENGVRKGKKGNLKTKGCSKNPRRVSFDPLALLLDAALEGELELVKKTAKEVPNPSAANDEGITALHNAICAGHLEIVKFLVEFGCDVNAQDSDGWTPLHCAASCNNLLMVKYLVERGACIFATTFSDHETAAEKCEEDEEGFDSCSQYLYSLQEKLGILNGGSVYALYDYESTNTDELSFRDGQSLVVLRKGDDLEREWWWSKYTDREGYVPRNLLGLHPRVTVKRDC